MKQATSSSEWKVTVSISAALSHEPDHAAHVAVASHSGFLESRP